MERCLFDDVLATYRAARSSARSRRPRRRESATRHSGPTRGRGRAGAAAEPSPTRCSSATGTRARRARVAGVRRGRGQRRVVPARARCHHRERARKLRGLHDDRTAPPPSGASTAPQGVADGRLSPVAVVRRRQRIINWTWARPSHPSAMLRLACNWFSRVAELGETAADVVRIAREKNVHGLADDTRVRRGPLHIAVRAFR